MNENAKSKMPGDLHPIIYQKIWFTPEIKEDFPENA